jgi:hypothetical protein
MKLNDVNAIRYEDVEILFYGEESSESRLVGIGDGSTVFDENFEFDDKVFYYFHDEADFEKAHNPMNFPSMFDFYIKGEYK